MAEEPKERKAFEAWAASVGYHTERDMFQREKYQSTITWELWSVWQARAALSAPGHGEQVRHMVPEPVRDAMARRCLWLAFCWNDHNFGPAHEEARKEALKHGIDSFDAANEWLAAAPSAGSQKEQGE